MGLSWSCVNPPKRLHVFKVRVFGGLVGQCDALIVAYLRNHNDSPDFFDLRVVIRTYTIHIPRNLHSQVRNANESFEDIFGQNIGVADFH